VALDDLERRNSPNRRVISQNLNLVAFGADYVKVVEDSLYTSSILSAAEM